MKKNRTNPDRADPARRLAAHRARIDRLDRRIVDLLNARTSLALAIGHIKREIGDPVFSPSREREVMQRIAVSGRGPLRAADLRAIYREIMAAALAVEGGLVLGVLRSDGAGGVAAARRRFGDAALLRSFSTPLALGRALARGRIALAVVSARHRKSMRAHGAEIECVGVSGVPSSFHLFARSSAS